MPATNTYDAIQSYTLTSNTTDVTFSSIPQTYTDLRIIIVPKITSGGLDMFVTINSDTASNYSYTQLYGTTSAQSYRASNQSTGIAGATFASNDSMTTIDFFNYSNTTTYKTHLVKHAAAGNSISLYVNLWRSTAAITSLKFSSGNPAGTFTSGSTFSLYGIKAA